MLKRILLPILFLPSLLWASGGQDRDEGGKTVPQIFTSNYPLYYAVETVLGGRKGEAELLWLFPDDEDPAFWEPSREDLTALQGADLLLFNGAGYEKWRSYAFLEESRIVDSSESFRDLYIDTGEGAVHSHGGGAEHSHGGTAFTLWLDLKQYERQLEAAVPALADIVPERESLLLENQRALQSEIRSLDRAFVEAGVPLKGEILLASHPVYQYFGRAYLGEIKMMLWEPDLYPSEEEWAVLEALKEESSARFMIWEDEPLPETRERLEGLGLELIIIRPGFAMPETGGFMDILKANLEELRRAGSLL